MGLLHLQRAVIVAAVAVVEGIRRVDNMGIEALHTAKVWLRKEWKTALLHHQRVVVAAEVACNRDDNTETEAYALDVDLLDQRRRAAPDREDKGM